MLKIGGGVLELIRILIRKKSLDLQNSFQDKGSTVFTSQHCLNTSIFFTSFHLTVIFRLTFIYQVTIARV